jgi:hypothetical protein
MQAPGKAYQYTSGGYLVAQQMIKDATCEPVPGKWHAYPEQAAAS